MSLIKTLIWLLQFTIIEYVANTAATPETQILALGESLSLTCPCNSEVLKIDWRLEASGREKKLSNWTTEWPSNTSLDENYADCKYHFWENGVTFEKAGLYSCLIGDSSRTTNVIVVDGKVACEIIAPLSSASTKNLHVISKYDSVMINCSFNYRAPKPCRAIPLWHNQATDRELTALNDIVNIGIENKHLWLSFNGSTQFTNGTVIKLSVEFNCRRNGTGYGKGIATYDTSYISPKFYFVDVATGPQLMESTVDDQQSPVVSNFNKGLILVLFATLLIALIAIFGVLAKYSKFSEKTATEETNDNSERVKEHRRAELEFFTAALFHDKPEYYDLIYKEDDENLEEPQSPSTYD